MEHLNYQLFYQVSHRYTQCRYPSGISCWLPTINIGNQQLMQEPPVMMCRYLLYFSYKHVNLYVIDAIIADWHLESINVHQVCDSSILQQLWYLFCSIMDSVILGNFIPTNFWIILILRNYLPPPKKITTYSMLVYTIITYIFVHFIAKQNTSNFSYALY